MTEVNSKTREGGSELVEEKELFLALDNVVKGMHYMTSNKQRQGDEIWILRKITRQGK